MIPCPKCGTRTNITDCRIYGDRDQPRRRRVCPNEACGYKFSTLEIALYSERDLEIADWIDQGMPLDPDMDTWPLILERANGEAADPPSNT